MMRLHHLTLFLTISLFLLCLSTASIQIETNATTCLTNAECLQKELPLIKPSLSKKRSALRPRVSPGLDRLYKLKITRNDGTTLGYISANPSNRGTYSYTTSFAQALVVSNPSTLPSNLEIFYIPVDNGISYPWLAGHTGRFADGFPGPSNPDFSPASKNYAYLVPASSPVPPGPATNDHSLYNARGSSTFTGAFDTGETAIWSYDPTSMALMATWTNSDGTAIPTQFIFTGEQLAITGSAAEYAEFCGSCGSFQVFIHLVDPDIQL